MVNWFRSTMAGGALMLALTCQSFAGPEIRVADNVFLVPDAKAKVVTLWMIVHAGCRDEEGGQCRGLAHYLEHLMFLGRSEVQAAAAAQAFAAGQTNAYTTMRATAYYQTAPVREGQVNADLDKLFALYATRLQKLDAAQDEAERERNVVLQEFNYRRSDSARSKFYTEINRKLQPDHPVSQPVIGSKEDIAAFTLPRAKVFHDRWYAKNNVEFVVYGPVSADDVKAIAARHIDALPEKEIPKRGWLDARRTFQPLNESVRVADAEIKRREVVFEKIVRYEDPEPRATGASNAILFDYLNSQMKGSLTDVFVEQKKLAVDIGISAKPFGDGVMWYSIAATLEDGVQPETLSAGIADYIQNLANTGVESSVVDRLKRRRALASAERAKDAKSTLSELTNWFSANRSFSEWRTWEETTASVKAEHMNGVLKAMAGPGRQVMGVLSPKS